MLFMLKFINFIFKPRNLIALILIHSPSTLDISAVKRFLGLIVLEINIKNAKRSLAKIIKVSTLTLPKWNFLGISILDPQINFSSISLTVKLFKWVYFNKLFAALTPTTTITSATTTTTSTTTPPTTTSKETSYCPDTYPFAYLDGDYCCQSGYEKNDPAKDGDLCDGSKIQIDSKCCFGNKYNRCNSPPCENYPG